MSKAQIIVDVPLPDFLAPVFAADCVLHDWSLSHRIAERPAS